MLQKSVMAELAAQGDEPMSNDSKRAIIEKTVLWVCKISYLLIILLITWIVIFAIGTLIGLPTLIIWLTYIAAHIFEVLKRLIIKKYYFPRFCVTAYLNTEEEWEIDVRVENIVDAE